MPHQKPSIPKVIVTGAVAGLVATLIMDQFHKLLAAGQKSLDKQQKAAQGESPWQIAHEQAEQEAKEAQQEGSTEIVARKIAGAAGQSLEGDQKKAGGQAVHYTFGILTGISYAITSEFLPELATGGGTAFGTLLFLAADEIAVPAFRLSPPPTETPVSGHLQHWAAHVVYGGSLDLVRGIMRRIL